MTIVPCDYGDFSGTFLDWRGDWRSTPADVLQFSAKRDANYRRTRHITRDRRALTYDDHIGAVAHFQRATMMDVDQAAKAMKDAEIEDFLKGSITPPAAACGSMGSGSQPGAARKA